MFIRRREKVSMAVVLSLLSVSIAAGCTADPPNPATGQNDKPATQKELLVTPIPEAVKDTSDLPDWTGKQLKLSIWYGTGSGGDMDQRTSAKDVVTPEITRVTGVTLDRPNSYDNAGQNSEVKMGLLAASNNWPHLATNINSLNQLVDAGKVYDLTELLPKYAPNVMKKIPASMKNVWSDPKVNGGKPGKAYAVPLNVRDVIIEDIQDRTLRSPANSKAAVAVRDDILKKLYPNAKTQQEIEELYMKNGKFTKEEILDVAFTSKEQFYKFLRDVKALEVKEGNQLVSPIWVANGTDNWALMTFLSGALNGHSINNNYFTYWDKETKKVEFMFKQPFFKETLKDFNKLVREGVASKESLIDPANTFRQKMDNGMYAVSYFNGEPNKDLLKKAGKPYSYRRVYIDIPLNDKKFVYEKPLSQGNENIVIFKDKVKEEDLPQVLRWLDYLVSDANEKLRYWGPRSAGLFEENGGKRVFKDKELERHMVYKEPSDKGLHYNLYNGTRESGLRFGQFNYLADEGSRFHPTVVYDRERSVGQTNSYFGIGRVERTPQTETKMPHIYKYIGIPEVDSAWKARKAFEDALTKALAASSDSEFEKLFSDFLTIAEKSGYNDSLRAKVDAEFRKDNADYMGNLK